MKKLIGVAVLAALCCVAGIASADEKTGPDKIKTVGERQYPINLGAQAAGVGSNKTEKADKNKSGKADAAIGASAGAGIRGGDAGNMGVVGKAAAGKKAAANGTPSGKVNEALWGNPKPTTGCPDGTHDCKGKDYADGYCCKWLSSVQ